MSCLARAEVRSVIDSILENVNGLGLGDTACGALVFPVTPHRLLSVVALGQIGVVGGACELNIIQAVVAATAVGTVMVVKLKTVAFGAATTTSIHKSTLLIIPLGDGSLDRGRDMA